MDVKKLNMNKDKKGGSKQYLVAYNPNWTYTEYLTVA